MTQFRGVLLDIDGTLVDSNDAHTKAWLEAFHENGYDAPYEKARRAIGMGSDNFLPEVLGVEKESPEGKKLSESWTRIFTEKYLPDLKAFPGSREMVQKMKDRGLKIVVATSAKGDMAAPLLKIAGIEDLVEEQTTASDAKNSKPAPDIIQASLEKSGCAAEQVVMIGDTPYDIESATKAGVKTIAFRCGGWNDPDLKRAIAVYDGPSDLVTHFDQSPLASS